MKRKSGLAFHVYHNELISFCYSYDERMRYIEQKKPAYEVPLRKKLLQIIPEDRLPTKRLDDLLKARVAYVKAGDAYYKARVACVKARVAYDKAGDAYDKAGVACVKAWDAYDKAGVACVKARDAYYKANKKELLKLHEELCPDCPWDGKTIFPIRRQ